MEIWLGSWDFLIFLSRVILAPVHIDRNVTMMYAKHVSFIPELSHVRERLERKFYLNYAEAACQLHRVITQIKERGVKAGVSLNPGFGGQKFIEQSLPKIRKAREMVNSMAPDVAIEVDGGVTLDNIKSIVEDGADIFVAGASVFGSGNYGETVRTMKAIVGSNL
jgi:pentose-5-phosphate-3-epimerase